METYIAITLEDGNQRAIDTSNIINFFETDDGCTIYVNDFGYSQGIIVKETFAEIEQLFRNPRILGADRLRR